MTPEEARSWLIEQGELTLDDAAAATARGKETEARMDRLAQADGPIGDMYRTVRGRKGGRG